MNNLKPTEQGITVKIIADKGDIATAPMQPASTPPHLQAKEIGVQGRPVATVPVIDAVGHTETSFEELSIPIKMQVEDQVNSALMSAGIGVTRNGIPLTHFTQPRSGTSAEIVANQQTSLPPATELARQHSLDIWVAVMGATGTGKSTFINLLTHDETIQIGHDPESETFNIQAAHYIDQKSGRRIVLVDMPGFDDSRDGVTDTDILEKIIRFLEPESGEGRKLNGIIYMHRISDPRVGGVARKNLKMFHALCGEQTLRNVRIVTTNWSRVSEQDGNEREAALRRGAFEPLLKAGAQTCRHANTLESAQQIMSQFTSLTPVTTQIQEELRAGKTLADTSAGIVLTAEMRDMQKKHEKELADMKKELEEAAQANDEALRSELEQERKTLEEKMARTEVDRKRLDRTLDRARSDLAAHQHRLVEMREKADEEAARLRAQQAATERETRRLREELQANEAERRELERRELEANAIHDRRMEKLAKEHDAKMKAVAAQLQEFERRARNDRLMEQLVKEHEAQIKALDEDRRKRENEEKVRNARRMEQFAREREERVRVIKEREQGLQRDADRARQKQLDLEQRLNQVERQKREIEEDNNRGMFGGFFSSMADVVADSAGGGRRVGKVVGTVAGGLVGAVAATPVALVRAIGRGITQTN